MIERRDRVAYKAYPLGFCAGVKWAIENAQRELGQHGRVLIYGNLVNNHLVLQQLASKGAHQVFDVNDIQPGDTAMITAHGLSEAGRQRLRERQARIVDSTCPLVESVYRRIQKALQIAIESGKIAKILYICKDTTHVEPRNIIEEAPGNIHPIMSIQGIEDLIVEEDKMYFIDTQTTLNIEQAMLWIELIKEKIPELSIPMAGDVCYATKNRQGALRMALDKNPDLLLVFGSVGISSNTRELFKIAEGAGVQVYALERAVDLSQSLVSRKDVLAITAGASAPPEEPQRCLDMLQSWGYKIEELRAAEEPSYFRVMPKVEDYRPKIKI